MADEVNTGTSDEAALPPAAAASAAVPETPDKPLEGAALEKMRARVLQLGTPLCNDAIIGAAQRIAEIEHRGNARNVFDTVPLLKAEVIKVFDKKGSPIDLNGDGEVRQPELTAALIAAAQVANKYKMKLEDLGSGQLDEIVAKAGPICKQLLEDRKPGCKR